MSLNALTIKEAHEGLAHKKFSCTELTQECLDQIERVDKDIQAFLTVCADEALECARRIDDKIAHGGMIGVLEGIPVALKDNLMLFGMRTTAGSKMLDTYKASYTATVVSKLQQCGAVIVGKTNLDEFAMGSSTENSGYWVTRNPWDTERVAGGSSGGSAAAVAADECIYALGSDTGGSIRQPASLCGITGLKPTYGSVSRYGLIAMASSFDQIGPLGKTVEDTALVFDAIRGKDPHDGSSACAPHNVTPTVSTLDRSIRGMKIGIPRDYSSEGMDSDVSAVYETALEEMRRAGAELVDISLPHAPYALSVYYIVMPAEVSSNLARFDGIRYGVQSTKASSLEEVYRFSRVEGLGKEVRRRIILGTYVLAAGYYDAYYKKAQLVRELVRKDFDQAFARVDCIATPTSPVPAFEIGERTSDPLTMYLADIFTVSANIAGIPGLSVPCGFVRRSGRELPVGLQFLGAHFDEQTILRASHYYQQATDWHTRKALLY